MDLKSVNKWMVVTALANVLIFGSFFAYSKISEYCESDRQNVKKEVVSDLSEDFQQFLCQKILR